MNWSNGLGRLGLLVALACLSVIRIEAGPSLFETTRDHVAAVNERYAREQAHLSERIMPPPEAVASQVGSAEMMVGTATLAMLVGLGMVGWVVAGFRRT
jgi:hypothetical protein